MTIEQLLSDDSPSLIQEISKLTLQQSQVIIQKVDIEKASKLCSLLFQANVPFAADLFLKYFPQWKKEPPKYSLIDLLNSACAIKSCREYIKEQGMDFISDCLNNAECCDIAFLVQAKLVVTEKKKDLNDLLFLLNKFLEMENDIGAEGLAFLSSIDDLKPEITNRFDQLSKFKKDSKFGIASTVLNLVTLPKEFTEEEKKIVELHKMVDDYQQPETKEQVKIRIQNLIKCNLFSLLNSLLKQSTKFTKLVIAKTFSMLISFEEFRGNCLQSGAATLLQSFSHEIECAHALARLCITCNPKIVLRDNFDGIISPIILLITKGNNLQKFESLLALTNLLSVAPTEVLTNLYNRKILSELLSLQFDDNELIQRAATESICNFLRCEQVLEYFLKTPQKLDVMFALCSSDSQDTVKAASGSLAILSSCEPFVEIVRNGLKYVDEMLRSKNDDIILRVLTCIRNIGSPAKYNDLIAPFSEGKFESLYRELKESQNTVN